MRRRSKLGNAGDIIIFQRGRWIGAVMRVVRVAHTEVTS